VARDPVPVVEVTAREVLVEAIIWVVELPVPVLVVVNVVPLVTLIV
jgi:hypothetical protein